MMGICWPNMLLCMILLGYHHSYTNSHFNNADNTLTEVVCAVGVYAGVVCNYYMCYLTKYPSKINEHGLARYG
jgi:hypothetical protein